MGKLSLSEKMAVLDVLELVMENLRKDGSMWHEDSDNWMLTMLPKEKNALARAIKKLKGY